MCSQGGSPVQRCKQVHDSLSTVTQAQEAVTQVHPRRLREWGWCSSEWVRVGAKPLRPPFSGRDAMIEHPLGQLCPLHPPSNQVPSTSSHPHGPCPGAKGTESYTRTPPPRGDTVTGPAGAPALAWTTPIDGKVCLVLGAV